MLLKSFIRKLRLPALIFGLLAGLMLLLVRVQDPYMIRTVRELAFDQLQISHPRVYQDVPVRVVDIDEKSLATFGQWPWPRSLLAELVSKLAERGAAAVAFDFVFVEPDRASPARIWETPAFSGLRKQLGDDIAATLPDTDSEFASAISRNNVVLGFAATNGPEGQLPSAKASFAVTGERASDAAPRLRGATHNLMILETAAKGLGSISLSPASSEGVLRRVPLLWANDADLYPSLSLETLRVAQGERTIVVFGANTESGIIEGTRTGQFSIPTTRDGEVWIYYSDENSRRYVSAGDILSSAENPALDRQIAGNIIIIGTSAVGLLDIRTSARGERIPGVSVHAQILEQTFTGDFLSRPDWVEALELIVFAAIALLIVTTTIYLGPLVSMVVAGGTVLCLMFGSYWGFTHYRLLIDATFPLLAGALLLLLMTAYRYLTTDREKRLIRSAFAHYVAPSVLRQIERDPKQVKIGGELKEISILFMDVRSFTSLSEGLQPTAVVEFLNRLFAEMTADIVNHRGTLDKYIGDSVMAFWNAPTTVEKHQQLACEAALAMRASLIKLNQVDAFHFKSTGYQGADVRIATGIASGQACVGNIGSDALFNYSAIGDTVNVASRVQDACRQVGFDIVVSEPVARACSDLAFLYAGQGSLKGKKDRQPMYILVGSSEVRRSDNFEQLVKLHALLLGAADLDDSAYDDYWMACVDRAESILPDLREFYTMLRQRRGEFRSSQSADGGRRYH